MDRLTHNRAAKLFFPHVKMLEIDRVNGAIDNPDKKMIAMQRFGGVFGNKHMMDFFGLTKVGGHRMVNHTVDTAIMAAMLTGSKNAPELAMTHLMLDRMSNYLNDTMGTENKKVAESLFNAVYQMGKPARGERTYKRRKMFY